MSNGEVVLLDFWVSPFCMRVKIALAEKGVAFEAREEDLFGGKSELLLKSNPLYQKVPVLLHNGKPLCESSVIVSYIDETWTSSPLLPTCTYARAQARFWADYIDKKVFDAARNVLLSLEATLESATKELLEILKIVEEALGGRDYFGGDAFGYADVIAIPFSCWILASEKFGKFKVETEFPRFSAWIKRCTQRESVAKVVPDAEKVYEFALMMRKMQGL